MEPTDDIYQEYGEEEEEKEEQQDQSTADNNFEENIVVTTNVNENTCIICVNLCSKIVLIPCKHLIICNECFLKIQAQSLANDSNEIKCPLCREIVQDTIQVYNK